ncbi:hypothetical protein AWB70_07369 [Caballeronia cordobensis]|uniref:Uncharacterized protein n=1 Tax=Caballeronia cordobensis TaxID=1353886 RepID=A0A158JSH4_CABCO|nr:hypothetical protein [Caballeronia cordobensis]SAL71389.1 hypothetical protein AWB70_07369 [Caballeronia cordobensis]
MYAVGNYFIEILPEPLPGEGWTGSARFSRRSDYRRHASVTKVTLPSHILMPTMAAAESAIVSWARELVEHSGEVLEVSLQLAEDTHT